jgi:hypothetical protein
MTSLPLLRLRAYHALLRVVQRRARKRRMDAFVNRMGVTGATKIVDLGGNPSIWSCVPQRLDITILNLPGWTDKDSPSHHSLRFVEGDACDVPELESGRFDIVFSNSVIEHVGSDERQHAFAATVKRLARRYWVQTPAIWFPVEAHTGIPFWWFYPEAVRKAILRHSHDKLPAWSESMAEVRVLTRDRMGELFPGAQIYVETVAGIPKSYAAYSPT